MAFWSKKDNETLSSSPHISSSKLEETKDTKEAASSSRPLTEPTVIGGAGSVTLPSKDSSPTDSPSETKAVSFSNPEDSIADRFGKVRSALGPGTVIQGKLSFDTPVRIDGKLSGEIFSSKALIIGEAGEIDATVEVACLIILGKMRGKVKATEKIELYGSGSLDGDITTPAFAMQEGAHFSGKCHMGHAASVKTEVSEESTVTAALEAKAEKKGETTKKEKNSPAAKSKEETSAAQAVH